MTSYPIGSGAYTLLFRSNNDYTGIKHVVLNATLRYDLILPDNETLRIPDSVDVPITGNKEKIDRDIGDVFEVEVSGTYELSKGFNVTLDYKFGASLKDECLWKPGICLRIPGRRNRLYRARLYWHTVVYHFATLYGKEIPGSPHRINFVQKQVCRVK